MSTPKIVRLNASALYALGMDRPTVEALINSIRITGDSTTSPTVSELSNSVDNHDGAVQQVQQDIILLQLVTDFLESAPVPVQEPILVDESWKIAPPRYEQTVKEQAPVDDSWQTLPTPAVHLPVERMESLESGIRQVAEQVAVLMKAMQESAFIDAQIRQVAENQAKIMTFIDEIKQGTML